MASVVIQKRSNKKGVSYVVTYRDPVTFKSVYYATCKKRKDALKTKRDLEQLIDEGRPPKTKRAKPKMMKWDEIADGLEKSWEKKLRKGELKSTTLEGYKGRLTVINRVFAGRVISTITEAEISGYLDDLHEAWSAITSNRTLFIIKQVFQQAIDEKVIGDDPAAKIGYRSEKGHERNRFLLPDELKKLVEASQKTRTKFYMPALIYLGAEHGASRQEALTLQWSDIKFEGEGVINFFRTKNGNERTEYLMPRSKQALLDWQKHLEWMRHRKRLKVADERNVFCRLDGTPISRFDKAWRRICKIAGIEDFHYHDLRHTFCSNLIMSGSDLKVVKDMIGHRDLAMTDRYTHLTNLHKRHNQQKLAEHYGS